MIYGFDHADGLLSNKVVLRYPERPRRARGAGVPAGLAVSRDGKSLWVANAFGHTIARFDVSGELRAEIPLGDGYVPLRPAPGTSPGIASM